MNRSHALATLALAAAAGACSDFATEPDRHPAALQIIPDTVRLAEGDDVQFTVQVLDQDGVPYGAPPSWAPPVWITSDGRSLELDEAGAGRALRPGESRARVELSGLSAESVVRTNPLAIGLSVPFAYITQSSQSTRGRVPLVAGRDGLVRVYVSGTSVNFFEPRVRVRFLNGGSEVHSTLLHPDGPSIPRIVDEGDLQLSYDATVPGSVIQPGLSMVVEIDPDGRTPSTPGSELRVPTSGALDLDVRQVPPFRLRLVPVNQSSNGRSSSISVGSAPDLAALAEDVFPFSEFDVDVRQPFTTAARMDTEAGWFQLIEEIYFLRHTDGSERYYYGGFDVPPGTNIAGLGYVGYPTSIGMDDDDEVIAHELGHNMGLTHAPCGGPAGVDRDYPYPDGSIGQHGYERTYGRLYRPEDRYDLMSYCRPVWISDYNYDKVLAYRDTSEYDAAALAQDGAQETLVVWGGVRAGELVLGPAVEWSGPVALPRGTGKYRLEGLDGAGQSLFGVAVQPLALDHGAASHFLVALPAELAHTDRLERLRLTGPEGRVERVRRASATAEPELDVRRRTGPPGVGPGRAAGHWSAAEYPLAVVRSRATGLVVAMSRDGTVELPGRTDALEVWLSDGVRSHRARMVDR